MHSSGGARAGGGYRGGGFHGGYYGGYHGGGYYHGYRGHYGYYGPAFGLYLGYWSDPWFWGYPYGYYGYPYYPYYGATVAPAPAPGDAPPMANQPAPQAAAPQAQACGNWQWNETEKRYHWVTNGCN